MKPVRVAYLITGLARGGAETMLSKLLSRTDRLRFSPSVISLMRCAGEPIQEQILSFDIPVVSLGMRPGCPAPDGLFRLAAALTRLNPDLLSGWEVHGNVAAWCAARLTRLPSVWNVRGSLDDLSSEKPRTRAWIRLLAALSRTPRKILYNSLRSRTQHEAAGYRGAGEVIPNGFDCARFRPDAAVRAEVRRELGIREGEFAAGMMARYHPVKDHSTMVAAAGVAARAGAPLKLILAGKGCDAGNRDLAEVIARAGLAGRVVLLGERDDAPRITAALDVACLSSVAEAFPNAVGEAMACGIPVAATDTGDTARLVEDCGFTVAPRNPPELGRRLLELWRMGRSGRDELGHRGRLRIVSEYSLERVARRFDEIHGLVAVKPVPSRDREGAVAVEESELA